MRTELHRITGEKSMGDLRSLCKEKTIVSNIIVGDEGAFSELFEHYHHAVYSHVLRFVKSPSLAADIVQDVFIKVWETRSTLKLECSIQGFLFTVAKNHTLNLLRRASREEAIKKEILRYTLTAHTENEDAVIYADLNRFADKAIQNLPPQRRQVFVMHKEEGKDCHQIASILGISKNTVRDHLTKAFKFIRVYLKVNAEITSVLLFLTFLS
jgi:RNA polymerase sigma-70 factor (ECF subfamily)